jgi:hypothetical protein
LILLPLIWLFLPSDLDSASLFLWESFLLFAAALGAAQRDSGINAKT